MSESFAELFEQSLSTTQMRPGAIVAATIVSINKDNVVVNAGLKSEGSIPVEQFRDEQGNLEVAVGDTVQVVLEVVEDGFGETRLSREKAKRSEEWIRLERAHETNDTITGIISGKVKGGFTVKLGDSGTIQAFLPGSLVDVRPVRDTTPLEGKVLEFKIIKLDRKRNNVVVSRRLVLESTSNAEREVLLDSIQEGRVMTATVKNLTDYGAFVDLGGIDGLLHITDMSWKRFKHPSEVVAVGDEIQVKVLKFDRERSRVSLGLKQLAEDPWADIARRYPEKTRLFGKVTNITDYGCFVEIEPGVEGLVHVSEMDWTNKNVHPNKIVQLGDEVEVMVLDIDEERRRISLGIKQCKPNPWDAFAASHNKNDKVKGKIKSITDFGIFIGLEGGIDGLVHLSDISWNVPGEEAVRNYKKNDEVEAIVLAVDPERERISLGIKQLEQDAFTNFADMHEKGAILIGKITEVDAKGATVDLGNGVEGYIRAAEVSVDKVEDARVYLKQGEEVQAKYMGADRKKRIVNLSIKAKDLESSPLLEGDLSGKASGAVANTVLGDLLKERMGNNNNPNN